LSEYTHVHPDYARLCLKAKCYPHSMKFLAQPITTYKSPQAPVVSTPSKKDKDTKVRADGYRK